MRLVSGLYLFGAGAAFLFMKWALAPLGVSAMIAISLLGIAVPAGLLGSGRKRWIPASAAAAVVVLSFFPFVENGFLYLYEGTSNHSSKNLSDPKVDAARS